MRTILKIVSIIFVFLNVNLQAENIDECKSDLYFANGIMMKYSEKDALKMWKKEVKKLLASNIEEYAKIANRKISYNQSQGFLDDLIESFEQIMDNEWGWSEFSVYFSIFLEEKGIQEDWITHLEDLSKQVKNYQESIKFGHNVIVVAHSQGNYYTNEAYELLADWMKPYFHMMGVATPADHVAGDGPYVLFENDFINLVVTGLSPNRTDTRHAGFPSVAAHDFYESYLKETTTRKDIQDFIINQVIAHKDAPTQWETDQEFELNTCNYKITVKHRYDPNIEMPEKVYPFNPSKKLYQVNGEWVKASCDGENILGEGHDIPTWDGKQDNECLMIDNPQEEKIKKGFNCITANYDAREDGYQVVEAACNYGIASGSLTHVWSPTAGFYSIAGGAPSYAYFDKMGVYPSCVYSQTGSLLVGANCKCYECRIYWD